MNYTFLPSVFDLGELLTYLLTNPYLFVSSSTVGSRCSAFANLNCSRRSCGRYFSSATA